MPMKIHAIRVNGITTSICLEPEFWEEYKLLAEVRGLKVSELTTMIASRQPFNLSSAIRLEILHAKSREIANLQKMVASVAKMGLNDQTPAIAERVRAAGRR